jgi:hypothetical protein
LRPPSPASGIFADGGWPGDRDHLERKFETTSVMTQGEMLDALHVASNVHYVAPAESVHA